MTVSREEEIALFTRIAAGESDLRHVAVEKYLYLIPMNLHNFDPRYQEDLEQEAAMALYRAVDKFDLERGCRFKTYAAWWIRQAAMQYIYHHSSTVRIPTHMRKLLSKIRSGRDVSDISHSQLKVAEGIIDRSTGSMMRDPAVNDVQYTELGAHLEKALLTLDEREQRLVRMRFQKSMVYREIGEIEGISLERARQIINRALTKLRSQTLEEHL